MSPTRTTKNAKSTARRGTVAFVGTGPGDARLLTVRAVELLGLADAVVLDRMLTAEDIRVHCREDVEFLDGAAAADGAELTHAGRAKLAVAPAKSGKRVVCLRDGDPTLFGGLAEEAAVCARAGVGFEVVPGVSAALGVPTYAGVPLTTDKVRDVHVVDAEGAVDWATVGAGDATLVVLGAVGQMAQVSNALVAAGRAPGTPVVVTTQGTTTDQRTVTSTLESVAADVKAAKLQPPAVTVVGDVVGLRDKLSWFETKPLFGWRVLVPRTKEQAAELSEQLRAYGAVPEEVPTISVEPPRTPQQMERALKGLVSGRYQWIAFTSRNAVRAIREKFEEYGLDARAFAGIKVAAVGEQTAEALEHFGVKPDLVPSGQQSSEGLLADWPPYDSVFDPIDRVLLPRADIATDTLAAGLKELGWEVDDVTAYRTVRAAPPPATIREAIKGGGFDAVLFTSSSTVRNLVGIAGKPHACTIVACIGPATAKTAEEVGLRVDVMSPEPSALLLAEALAEFGTARREAAEEAGEPVLRPSERRAGGRRKAR
ncbi:MAG: uroporphyrinogen-III synthase [Actinomycetes bacterium]